MFVSRLAFKRFDITKQAHPQLNILSLCVIISFLCILVFLGVLSTAQQHHSQLL